jgi:hypothetical protein
MDPFRVLNYMQNLPTQVFEDSETQNRMKEVWGMLDDLAKNDPDEYAKFIEQNLKAGLDDMKKSDESRRKSIKSLVGFAIKTYTEDKVKVVIINFCHSEKVLGPLRNDKNLADALNVDTWSFIPSSFSEGISDPRPGKKLRVYYDAHINTGVYLQTARNLNIRAQVISNVLLKLSHKEKFKLLYDKGEFKYYEKEYRGFKAAKSPPEHLLDLAADPEEYTQNIKCII